MGLIHLFSQIVSSFFISAHKKFRCLTTRRGKGNKMVLFSGICFFDYFKIVGKT